MRISTAVRLAVRAIFVAVLTIFAVKLFLAFISSPSSERLALASFCAFVAVGVIMVILGFRKNDPDFGVPSSVSSPEELILSDVRVPYASADRYTRFPLGRKFSGMPHVALLVCGAFLLLLTIFWIMSPLPPQGHWVYIARPASAHLLAGVPEDPVIVSVRRESGADKAALYVNSQRVEWPGLNTALRAELVRHVDRVVYIEGDDSLPYQDIAQVISIAREVWPNVPVVLKTPGLDPKIQELYKAVPELRRTSFRSNLGAMIYYQKQRNWESMFRHYDNEQRLTEKQFIHKMNKTNRLVAFEPSKVAYIPASDSWTVQGCALFSPSTAKNTGALSIVKVRWVDYDWATSDVAIRLSKDEPNGVRSCTLSNKDL